MDPTWLRNGARLRQHHLANEDGLSHFLNKKLTKFLIIFS